MSRRPLDIAGPVCHNVYMTTNQDTKTDRAAQIIELAMGGISIRHIKATPNAWAGYDIRLETGDTLRITLEDGVAHVYTLSPTAVCLTSAMFGSSCPPAAVAAYFGTMLR